MQRINTAVAVCMFVLLGAGCETGQVKRPGMDSGKGQLNVYSSYNPVKLDIMPLTEIVGVDNEKGESRIKVYVSLLDQFGCQVKTPGVFRFELYEHVERSAEPKGRRVTIWPDANLTDASENNNCWRDFLRVYQFDLDFEPRNKSSFILEITCLCADGSRLSDELVLNK
jgi:hypothetical protein